MDYFEEQQNNAFKPLTKNLIILDFFDCKYLGEIHILLKEKFGFPDYYGENWDSLFDCLDDRFCDNNKISIEIYGYTNLPKDLQEYCRTMFEIFDEIQRKYPCVSFKKFS